MLRPLISTFFDLMVTLVFWVKVASIFFIDVYN